MFPQMCKYGRVCLLARPYNAGETPLSLTHSHSPYDQWPPKHILHTYTDLQLTQNSRYKDTHDTLIRYSVDTAYRTVQYSPISKLLHSGLFGISCGVSHFTPCLHYF